MTPLAPEQISASADLPIIVGGCHRSGTSLVRRLLNSHSRIHCGPEVKFFRDFHGDYFQDPLAHLRFISSARSLLPDQNLLSILGSAFVEIHQCAMRRAGKVRWADKNPENVLYLRDWEALLKGHFLFVHVVRNPLDTLASISERKFPLSIPPTLGDRIAFYERYTRAGINFAERFPARSYRITYERLTTDPVEQLAKLMGWLGETAEKDQIDFHRQDHGIGLEDPKIVHTDRIHADGVGAWRRILSPADAEMIWSATGELWRDIEPDFFQSLHPNSAPF